MRVLLWNCNNGINKPQQISYFQSFKPDLAIIPELKEANLDALKATSAIWVTNNHSNAKPKGMGVLGFNGTLVTQLETDEDMEIFLPVKVTTAKMEFRLLAVWNFYWACKQGRFKGVKGDGALEYAALRHYLPQLESPSLIIGDWNLGPTFSQKAFIKICEMVGNHDFRSLYHLFFGLDETETQHSTFKSTRNTYHHLDQVFGCSFFQKHINSIAIPAIEDVVLSDHAPICVDFDLSANPTNAVQM